MGHQEKTRLDLRRGVLEEVVRACAELEEQADRHKKVINQQGRALEALANVITTIRGQLEEEKRMLGALTIRIALLHQPWYRRYLDRVAVWWADVVSRVQPDYLNQDMRATVERGLAYEADISAPTQAGAEMMTIADDHIHNFSALGLVDGIQKYRCEVPGCHLVATLEEIRKMAEVIVGKNERAKAAGVNGDQPNAKLQG